MYTLYARHIHPQYTLCILAKSLNINYKDKQRKNGAYRKLFVIERYFETIIMHRCDTYYSKL